MSRRKPKLPREIVLLYCTGRKTHDRRVLAKVLYMKELEGPGLWSVDVETGEGSGKSHYKYDSREGGPRGAYSLRCPSCRRDVRLNLERLKAITTGAVAVGLNALDVSNF